jgi:DNA (cytosine-5)-methyltransferase 1
MRSTFKVPGVAIDVFCGIGGLSYGLKKAGIDVVAGIDLDESCRYAFETNVKGAFLAKDIAEVTGGFLRETYSRSNSKIRILVGCAPCQPFSSHSNKDKKRYYSKKWNLLNEFKRLVQESTPDIVSMENVPNLANQPIFERFVTSLREDGYSVSYSTVFCPDYGIPQKRRRLVLLASKLGEINLIPKTHKPSEYVNVARAIGDLPSIQSGEICESDFLHRTSKLSPENLRRIRSSKPNGTWMDWDEDLILGCHKKNTGASYKSVYGRMDWNEPSPTITTQFYNYGTGRFGHPVQNRAITIREAAILQSFPRSYKFCKKSDIFSIKKIGIHIGNAVPVDLGYAIGKTINHHVRQYSGK